MKVDHSGPRIVDIQMPVYPENLKVHFSWFFIVIKSEINDRNRH